MLVKPNHLINYTSENAWQDQRDVLNKDKQPGSVQTLFLHPRKMWSGWDWNLRSLTYQMNSLTIRQPHHFCLTLWDIPAEYAAKKGSGIKHLFMPHSTPSWNSYIPSKAQYQNFTSVHFAHYSH